MFASETRKQVCYSCGLTKKKQERKRKAGMLFLRFDQKKKERRKAGKLLMG